MGYYSNTKGAFYTKPVGLSATYERTSTYGYSVANFGFSASNVVPTGEENSPRTLSVRYWRRVA